MYFLAICLAHRSMWSVTNYFLTICLAHRSMWSVTNYFLFNLTLADLMMATLNCLPSFIFMRDRYIDR